MNAILLSYLLGRIANIADASPSDIQTSVLGGSIALNNVTLRTDTLNSLLPFPIEEGKIARLTLKVPNPRTSDPLVVEAENAHVVFQLDLSKAAMDPTKEERLQNITSASILGSTNMAEVRGESASSHGDDAPEVDNIEMASSGIPSGEEEDLVSCLSENESISESDSGSSWMSADDGQGGGGGNSGAGGGFGLFSFLRDKAVDSVEWIWHRQIKIFSKNVHLSLPCDTRNEMNYEAVVEQFQVIIDPTEKLNAVEYLKVVTLIFKNAVVNATTPTGEATVVSVPSLEVKLTSVYANGVLVRKNSVVLFDDTVSLFADETSLFALMKCQATRAATLLVPVFCRRFLPLRRERSLWRYAFCSAIEMIHDKKRRFNYNPSHLQFYSQARRRYIALLESCHRQQRITEYREELAEVEEDLRYPDVVLYLRHYVQRRYNAAAADALVAEERKLKDNSVRTSLHLDTKKIFLQLPSRSALIVDNLLMAFRNEAKTVSVGNVSLSSDAKIQSFSEGAPESRIFSMEMSEVKGFCSTKVLLEPIAIHLRATDLCRVGRPFIECLHSVEVKYSATSTAAPAANASNATPGRLSADRDEAPSSSSSPGSLIVALPKLHLQLDSFLFLVSQCTFTKSVALSAETKYGAVVKTVSIDWNKDFLLLPVEVSMQPSGDVVVSELHFSVTHPMYDDFAAIYAQGRELVEQVPDHVWALRASPPPTAAAERASSAAAISATDFAPWLEKDVWQREKGTSLAIIKGMRFTCEPFSTSVAVTRTEISQVWKERRGATTRALAVRCAKVEVSATHYNSSQVQIVLPSGFVLFSAAESASQSVFLPSCEVNFVVPGLAKGTSSTCVVLGASEMSVVALASSTLVSASQIDMVDEGVALSAFECLVKSDPSVVPTCRAPYRASVIKLSMDLHSVGCRALLNAPLDGLVSILTDAYEYLCANVVPENMYQLFFSGYSDLELALSAHEACLVSSDGLPLWMNLCSISSSSGSSNNNSKAETGFAQCAYTGQPLSLKLNTNLKDLQMQLLLDPFQMVVGYTSVDAHEETAESASSLGARIVLDRVSCSLPMGKMPFWEERVQKIEVAPTHVSCDRAEAALLFGNNEQLLSCTVTSLSVLSAVEELSTIATGATRSPSDSDAGGSNNRSFGGGGGGEAASKGNVNSTAVDITECSLYVCPAVSVENWSLAFGLCQQLSSAGFTRISYHVESAPLVSRGSHDLGRAGKDVFFFNRHAVMVVEDSTFFSFDEKRRLVICDDTTVVFRRCTFSFNSSPFRCVGPTAIFMCEECTFTKASLTNASGAGGSGAEPRSLSKSGTGKHDDDALKEEGAASASAPRTPADLSTFVLNVHDVTAKVQIAAETNVLYSQRRLSCTYKEVPGRLTELHVHSKKAMSFYYEKQCKVKMTHVDSAQFFLQHHRRRGRVIVDTNLCISAVRLPLTASVLDCVNRIRSCYDEVRQTPLRTTSSVAATTLSAADHEGEVEERYRYSRVRAAATAATVDEDDFVDPFHGRSNDASTADAASGTRTGGPLQSDLPGSGAVAGDTPWSPPSAFWGVRKWQCHASTTKCSVDVLLVNHTNVASFLLSSALFFSSKETAEEYGSVECRGSVEHIELLNNDLGQCERVTSQPILFNLEGSLGANNVSLRCKVDNSVVLLQTVQVRCLLAVLSSLRQLDSLVAVRIENESGLTVELNRMIGEHVSVDKSLCLYKPIAISVGPSLSSARAAAPTAQVPDCTAATGGPRSAGRLYTRRWKAEPDLTVESYMDTRLVHHITIRTFVSVTNCTDMELTLCSNESGCLVEVGPSSSRSIPVPLLESAKLWCFFTNSSTRRRTMRAPLFTCEGTPSTSVAQLLRRKVAKTICVGAAAEDDMAAGHVELVDEVDGSSRYVRVHIERGDEYGGGEDGVRLVLAAEFATLINTCPLGLSVAISSVEKGTIEATEYLKPNGGLYTFYSAAESAAYTFDIHFATRNCGVYTSTKSIPLCSASVVSAAEKGAGGAGGGCVSVGSAGFANTSSFSSPTESVMAKSDKGNTGQMEVCFTRQCSASGVVCLVLSMPQLHVLDDRSGVPLVVSGDGAILEVEEEQDDKGGASGTQTSFLIATAEREEVVLTSVGFGGASTATICVCECLSGTCAVLPIDGTATSHVCLLKPCPRPHPPPPSPAVAAGGSRLPHYSNDAVHILPPLVFHNEGGEELTVRHYVLKREVSPTAACPVASVVKVGARAVANYSILANAGYTNWFLLSCEGCTSRDYVSITICPGARWRGLVKCGNHFYKVVFQKDGLLDSGHLSISAKLPPPVKVVNLCSQMVAKVKPLSVLYLPSARAIPFPVTLLAPSFASTGTAVTASSSVSSSVSPSSAVRACFAVSEISSAEPVHAFALVSGKQQCVYLIDMGRSGAKVLRGCGFPTRKVDGQGINFTLRASFSNASVVLRPTEGFLQASLPLLSVNVSSAKGVVDCVCSASGLSLKCSSTDGATAATTPHVPPVLSPFSLSLSVMALRCVEDESVEIGSASLRCAPLSLSLSAQFIALFQKTAAELYVAVAPPPPPPALLTPSTAGVPPPPAVWYVSIRCLEVSAMELSCHWDRVAAADLPNWGPCLFLLRLLPSMQFFEVRLPPLSTAFPIAKPANLVAGQLKSFYLSELISQIPSAASSFSFSQRKSGLVHLLYTRLGFLFGITPDA